MQKEYFCTFGTGIYTLLGDGTMELQPGTKPYYYNIVLNPDGTIRCLPFDGKRPGLWYFDGQFYFQKNVDKS